MENYIIRKFVQRDLDLLECDWRLLENGKDMSYFQTYNWYKSINDIVPNKGEVVYIEVVRNETVVLIAPLWILTKTYCLINKSGVYFWGKDGYSDYLNFVYSEFDGNALETMFSYLQAEYGVSHYYLDFLQKDLSVVSYIQRFINKKTVSFYYAAIDLPDNVETYTSRLSKHTRQNLRTAHNRMIKDGVSFESTILNGNIDNSIRCKCEEIRQLRIPYKSQVGKKQWSIKTKIHMFFDNKMRIHFPFKSVLDVDKNGNLLLITCENEIAAFFYYGYEKHKKRILVMTAGTNIKYARYSPGFYYMYKQIEKWVRDKSVEIVDFTRGGEKYKFDLGCTLIPVCNISFVYKMK